MILSYWEKQNGFNKEKIYFLLIPTSGQRESGEGKRGLLGEESYFATASRAFNRLSTLC
jgi:hypothetical protein